MTSTDAPSMGLGLEDANMAARKKTTAKSTAKKEELGDHGEWE
jgi:hypothetical protein